MKLRFSLGCFGFAVWLFLMAVPLAGMTLAAPSWQAEWERVLAAAKREGVVSILGTTGVEIRDALTQPFQKAYGIRVDYLGGSGSQQSSRVAVERRAGSYLWDVFVGGTTTGLASMIPRKAFAPMEPALILPEVTDPKNWRGGGIEFVDPGRQMVVMTPNHRILLVVNAEAADPKSFKSYRDLLDPKWKGRIAMDDPRRSGPGQASFTFFYLHPDLGPDFIRALARQEPLIFRDPSQLLNLIGQGKYPILIGPRDTMLADAMSRGIPIKIVGPNLLREGSDISPGAGNVAMFDRAPHPNAVKVYLNWLLSKDGQTGVARALDAVSNRLDAPRDHAPDWKVPQAGAIKTYTPQAMEVKGDLVKLLNAVFH
ncbi:MAG TPA: extracellular solute-binding protein [Candidatus Binatia bacterium]